METRYTIINGELYHYGVPGMKWGIRRYRNLDGTLTPAGKRRDDRLSFKTNQYATAATIYAKRAQQKAKNRVNGSRDLEYSDRYFKKATKTADKMSDGGKKVKKTSAYKQAKEENVKAGENYIKRKTKERVASAVTTAAISTGASFVGFAAGMPVGFLYIDPGPKYNLKR